MLGVVPPGSGRRPPASAVWAPPRYPFFPSSLPRFIPAPYARLRQAEKETPPLPDKKVASGHHRFGFPLAPDALAGLCPVVFASLGRLRSLSGAFHDRFEPVGRQLLRRWEIFSLDKAESTC